MCGATSERLRKGMFLSSTVFGVFFSQKEVQRIFSKFRKGVRHTQHLPQAGQLASVLLRSGGHFPTPGSFLAPFTKSHWRHCHSYRKGAVITGYY